MDGGTLDQYPVHVFDEAGEFIVMHEALWLWKDGPTSNKGIIGLLTSQSIPIVVCRHVICWLYSKIGVI